MKKITTYASLVAGFFLMLSNIAMSDQEEFLEGGHYELLAEVQPVQTGDKIEVVEMFWYRCPHCYNLEPYIIQWKQNKADDVEFVPMPAVLNEQWAFHARAFYTFQALGLTELLHGRLFHALHAERRRINSVEALAEWASEQGANGNDIINTFNSFAVETKLNFANVMAGRYGINGVPAIIVDGRYRTSATLAGGAEQLLRVIDFLVEKARKARQQ